MSTLSPGPTGLNRILLGEEAKLKALLAELFEGFSQGGNVPTESPQGQSLDYSPNNTLFGDSLIPKSNSMLPDLNRSIMPSPPVREPQLLTPNRPPTQRTMTPPPNDPGILAMMGEMLSSIKPNLNGASPTSVPSPSASPRMTPASADFPTMLPPNILAMMGDSLAPGKSDTLLHNLNQPLIPSVPKHPLLSRPKRPLPSNMNSAPQRMTGNVPPPYDGELPPVFAGSKNSVNGYNFPDEITAMIDELANSGGATNTPPKRVAGPPRLAQVASGGGQTSKPMSARPSVAPTPEPFSPEPFDMDLRGMVDNENNFANMMAGVMEPEAPESDMLQTLTDSAPTDDISPSPYMDKYMSHLSERPRHDDFKGSKGRSILSGVLKGLLGGDFGIGDAPHQKAIRSWADKGYGLKEGAELEVSGLKEDRLRLRDKNTDELNKKKLMLAIRKEVNDYNKDVADLEDKKLTREEKIRARLDLKKYRMGRIAQIQRMHKDRLPLERARTRAQVRSSFNKQDSTIPADNQGDIDREAHKKVANDPSLGKWYNAEAGGFGKVYKLDKKGKIVRYKRDEGEHKRGEPVVLEEADEATKKLLTERLVKAKEQVANMKRSHYSPGGFVSPFTTGDDEITDELAGLYGEDDEDYY